MHPSVQFTEHAIAALRACVLPETAENDSRIVPDVFFSWGTVEGEATTLELKAEPGVLFRVQARVTKTPRWMSFNFALGQDVFEAGDVLGLVAELEACEGETFPVFVRSTRHGETSDTYFQDSLQGSAERVVRTSLLSATGGDFLSGPPAYHAVVMLLPTRDFTLTLRDLRFFVIPAARGLRSQSVTLSSYAA